MGFQAVCACQFLSKAEMPLDSAEVAPIAPHFSLEASLQTVLVEQGWEHGFELQCQGQPKLGKQRMEERQDQGRVRVRVYLISVPNQGIVPLQGFKRDMSCLDWCGHRRRLPQLPARLGQLCPAPRSVRSACSTLSISHKGPGGFVSAPVPWLCRCSALDVLQQAGHCLGQDLLHLLPLPSTERRQDIAGHCHVTLWPPDADPEPGHLLGRKGESWGSFPSSVQS